MCDAPDLADMSEIPSGDRAKGGSSKGANLFLARQKLIADMMEEEEEAAKNCGNSQSYDLDRPTVKSPTSSTIDDRLKHRTQTENNNMHNTLEGESPFIPQPDSADTLESADQSSGSKSKGANLFLARQKKIAEMMEKEEEERRIAEEERLRMEEEQKRAEEERKIKEAERRRKEELRWKEEKRQEELRRKEEERRQKAEVKAAARAARFKSVTGKDSAVVDGEIHLENTREYIADRYHKSSHKQTTDLRISEPREVTDQQIEATVNKGRPVLENIEISESLTAESPNKLPQTVPPAVTILQKSRAGQMPKGAIYVGTDKRLDGNRTHADTFYFIPTSEVDQNKRQGCKISFDNEEPQTNGANGHQNGNSSPHSQIEIPQPGTEVHYSEKKNTTPRCLTDQKSSKGSSLYKKIYKEMHKVDKKDDENYYQPTYVFPENGELAEQKSDDTLYKPTYAFPESVQEKTSNKQPHPEVTEHKVITKTITKETQSSKMEVTHLKQEEVIRIRSAGAVRSRPGVPNSKQLHIDTTAAQNPFNKSESQSEQSDLKSPLSPKLQYIEVQKGGEIPIEGLRKPAPVVQPQQDVPKAIPEPLVGYNREPEPLTREQRDELDARRRQLMTEVEFREKTKKAQQEEEQRKARRHSDYFTFKDKSPIPTNRYDGASPSFHFSPSHISRSALTSPSPYTDSVRSPIHSPAGRSFSSSPAMSRREKPLAKVLYQFTAKHHRELGCERGEIVQIQCKVDKNWYEAVKDGKYGIVPVSYVQILREMKTPPARPAPPRTVEGSAVAKYNFTPQSTLELALRKGDIVSVTRRIDSNWFEGRLNSQSGIFPVSYVQIIALPEEWCGETTSTQTCRNSVRNERVSSSGYGSGEQLISPRSRLTEHHTSQPSSINQSPISINQSPNSSHNRTTINDHSSNKLLQEIKNLNNRPTINNNSPSVHNYMNIENSPKPQQNSPNQKFNYCGPELPSYRCLYHYKPQSEDEIELREGDIVHVVEKCSDGWYVGTSGRTGLFGTFPGNYVLPA